MKSKIYKAVLLVFINSLYGGGVFAAPLGGSGLEEVMGDVCSEFVGSTEHELYMMAMTIIPVGIVLYGIVGFMLAKVTEMGGFEDKDSALVRTDKYSSVKSAILYLLIFFGISPFMQLMFGVDVAFLLPYGGTGAC